MKKKMKMLIMGGMLALMAMPVKAQKWEGLADTPQMGWSTYCDRDGLQFWFKPLAGGDWAFTILNPTRQDISCCLNWQDFNPLPPFFREDTYLAREVYLLRNISSIG